MPLSFVAGQPARHGRLEELRPGMRARSISRPTHNVSSPGVSDGDSMTKTFSSERPRHRCQKRPCSSHRRCALRRSTGPREAAPSSLKAGAVCVVTCLGRRHHRMASRQRSLYVVFARAGDSLFEAGSVADKRCSKCCVRMGEPDHLAASVLAVTLHTRMGPSGAHPTTSPG